VNAIRKTRVDVSRAIFAAYPELYSVATSYSNELARERELKAEEIYLRSILF